MQTRTWARSSATNSKITTYGYTHGFLTSTDYSDNTPDITHEYDALGRQKEITTLVAKSEFTYNPSTLAPDTETISYNLDGTGNYEFSRILYRSQDTLLRDKGWELKNGTTIENKVIYTYGANDGRVASIGGDGEISSPNQFGYTYTANSNLIATVTSPVHTVTNTYEPHRNILDTKQNKVGTNVVSSYDYCVNLIVQRTHLTQTGTAFSSVHDVVWGYDALGQLTSAAHSIPGLDRAYQFDLIGNRISGGGLNPPSQTSYTVNALNQYTAIGTLNPSHDDDGNMESGPLPANINANSTLVWDGENRLISATVPGGDTVNFTYDANSRRIAETVGTTTKITVYDGWNPIAEFRRVDLQSTSLSKTYTWGTDLSGSMQGAGGVGGLLMVSEIANSQISNFFPTFDGNGNVSEYLNSSGTRVAHYEYDPFGNAVVSNGTKANDFAHRFSTKPIDATTGLYYYGYRFYDPLTGRWPSRDPLLENFETREFNIYSFISNDTLGEDDLLGLVEGSEANEARRAAMDAAARAKDGDESYSKDSKKGDFGPGTYKCNKFVADVVEERGAKRPMNGKWPYRAGDWANPKTKIPDWRPLAPGEAPKPGDIAAYALDGGGSSFSGHVGMMAREVFQM